MKKTLVLVLVLIIGRIYGAPNDEDIVSFNDRIFVKVLLYKDIAQESLTLASDNGFYLHTRYGNDNVLNAPTHSLSLRIDKKHNVLALNNKKYKGSWLRIVPKNGSIKIGSCEYEGSLILLLYQGSWILINEVGLEAYVCSVLKTESFPGWPLEVHKVMAIASRTYVISHMRKARAAQKPYDICNTNKHQTYSGKHARKELYTAVQETAGLFIAYKQEPIIAMFDISCGGVIPAYMSGTDFEQAPYLQRRYACTYCKGYKAYKWSTQISHNEVKKYLNLDRKNRITALKISKKDKAGIVNQVTIHMKDKKHTLSGKQFYSAFKIKGVKSFRFTVEHKRSTIHFHGFGMGHHLGLCQWGARGMVKKGFSCNQILDFYYPGTSLKRIVV